MEHLQTVGEDLSDFVAIVEEDFGLSYLNGAGRDMIGLSPDRDVRGLELTKFFESPIRERIVAEGAEIARRDGVFRAQGRLVGGSGSLEVAVCLRPVPKAGGKDQLGVIVRHAERSRMQKRIDWLLEASRVVLYACKAEGDFGATYISENARTRFGYEPRQFLEESSFWADNIHPDDRQHVFEDLPALFKDGHLVHEYRFRHADGSFRWVLDELTLERDAEGRPVELIGTWQDITERKEEQRLIERQNDAISELSTPLIPITDDLLVMPLVGTIDSRRADEVLTTLLEGVSKRSVRAAILDITGVAVVDTKVADTILKVAKAVRLLGADVILTGIRADVARTLVDIGADMREITTHSTLQAGVRYALRSILARSRNRVEGLDRAAQ